MHTGHACHYVSNVYLSVIDRTEGIRLLLIYHVGGWNRMNILLLLVRMLYHCIRHSLRNSILPRDILYVLRIHRLLSQLSDIRVDLLVRIILRVHRLLDVLSAKLEYRTVQTFRIRYGTTYIRRANITRVNNAATTTTTTTSDAATTTASTLHANILIRKLTATAIKYLFCISLTFCCFRLAAGDCVCAAMSEMLRLDMRGVSEESRESRLVSDSVESPPDTEVSSSQDLILILKLHRQSIERRRRCCVHGGTYPSSLVVLEKLRKNLWTLSHDVRGHWCRQ
ncbi:hypothetical protein PUN28_007858 [Cardiocondyla obscurior]|uniref:Uncharacterized protein n=1 Tax=Cardiocondyla obscurior TaxID=286306 RepID=A0AAW2G040_9HYME